MMRHPSKSVTLSEYQNFWNASGDLVLYLYFLSDSKCRLDCASKPNKTMN